MPLESFRGETFVAFIDISGFKELMKIENSALEALDNFYDSGYREIQNREDVQGLFISDCGILYTKTQDHIEGLKAILAVIKGINIRMMNKGFMTTTSIAYGHFMYERRMEFDGIGKNPIYGNAYLSAFLDNEIGAPKIQPGQCRLIKDKIPFNLDEILEGIENDDKLSFLKSKSDKYYYYYWMVNDLTQIETFERNYNNAYQLKYSGMLQALRGQL